MSRSPLAAPVPRFRSTDPLNVRNLLWLEASNGAGLLDPMTGRQRIYTQVELAALWGVTDRAVRLGIASARARREAINDAAIP